MFKHLSLLIITLLYAGTAIRSQADPLLRIELDIPNPDVEYFMLPADTCGFLVTYQTIHEEKDMRIWKLKFYDQLLNEKWESELPVISELKFTRFDYDDGYLFIAYYNDDKSKGDEINLQILKLNCHDGNFEMFGKAAPSKSYLKSFNAIDQFVFTGFNTSKDQVEILKLDTENRMHDTFFRVEEHNAMLEDVLIINHSGILAAVNYYISKTEQFMNILHFDMDGYVKHEYMLKADEEKKLNTAKLSFMEGHPIMIGSYDIVKSGVGERKYFNNESTGFYFASLLTDQPNQVKYYNFLNFQNFTGVMVGTEYQKLKQKNLQKPGEESLEYDLLLHDIYLDDSTLYFIGEAFFEEYHTETDFYYDYYGRPVPVTYTVFDGYRYFNAFITGFDLEGNMLWDNGFELLNLISYQLQNRINFYQTGDDIVLAYNQDSKIISKIFSDGEIMDGMSQYEIETDYLGDKIIESYDNSLVYWYDNYFLASGIQTVHNRNTLKKNKRIVFYVNKLGFE